MIGFTTQAKILFQYLPISILFADIYVHICTFATDQCHFDKSEFLSKYVDHTDRRTATNVSDLEEE